jgi:glycosyltransferase involved in cell wall biosynthesis
MPDIGFLAVTGAYGQQLLPDLPNVEVIGQVPGEHMRERVYGRTRVLIMPSSYESWGRAGAEALASGIPVIAHPTPGLSEALADGGIFVDRADLAGYEAVIRKLQDPAEYELAGKRARARSADLDPAAELGVWCTSVEALAARS